MSIWTLNAFTFKGPEDTPTHNPFPISIYQPNNIHISMYGSDGMVMFPIMDLNDPPTFFFDLHIRTHISIYILQDTPTKSVLHFYIWTQWHVHISICSIWTLKKHPHTHFWCPRRRDPEPMCGCSFTVVELIYYVACHLAPFTQQEL